jgi:hypothetical protein
LNLAHIPVDPDSFTFLSGLIGGTQPSYFGSLRKNHLDFSLGTSWVSEQYWLGASVHHYDNLGTWQNSSRGLLGQFAAIAPRYAIHGGTAFHLRSASLRSG